jgi:hypothetical protein
MIKALEISLIILAIYASMQPGMILSGVRILLGKCIRGFVFEIYWRVEERKNSNKLKGVTLFSEQADEIRNQIEDDKYVYVERISSLIEKPLYECITCMGGIWTVLLYPILFGFDIEIIKTILLVIGINTLIAGLISRLYE